MSSGEIVRISDFNIHFVKSTRAKHILLRQNAQGDIILTCPKFCPKLMAVGFAKKQLPWIRAHVQYAPKKCIFYPGDVITLLGKEYQLKVGKMMEEKGKTIFISGTSEFFHRRVCSYAQKKLLSYIQEQVAAHQGELHRSR